MQRFNCTSKEVECDELKTRAVCGTDNQTYANRCHLLRTQCAGHKVSLKHRGPCKGICFYHRDQLQIQTKQHNLCVLYLSCKLYVRGSIMAISYSVDFIKTTFYSTSSSSFFHYDFEPFHNIYNPIHSERILNQIWIFLPIIFRILFVHRVSGNSYVCDCTSIIIAQKICAKMPIWWHLCGNSVHGRCRLLVFWWPRKTNTKYNYYKWQANLSENQ